VASIQKHSNGHWKAIGESNMTPHGLRHAAASLAIALSTAMVDHPYIRHATARMTLDLYGHLFPDQLDDVADRLDAIGRAAAQNSCGQSAVNRETRPLRPPAGASDKPLTCADVGGPGRDRTDDSRGVNAVLYQLSYRPPPRW